MAKQKTTDSKLEDELTKLIKKIIDDYENRITKEEIKEIVSELIPEIDKLISIKIIQHFKELANHIIKNFKIED